MYTVEYQYLFAYRPLFYELAGKPMLSEPRPAIHVTLHSGLLKLQTIAQIDSGSTYSLFDYQIGKNWASMFVPVGYSGFHRSAASWLATPIQSN